MRRLEKCLLIGMLFGFIVPARGIGSLRCTRGCEQTTHDSLDEEIKHPLRECRAEMRLIACIRACPSGKERDLFIDQFDKALTPVCNSSGSELVARRLFEEFRLQMGLLERQINAECINDGVLPYGNDVKPSEYCSVVDDCLRSSMRRWLVNTSTPVARMAHVYLTFTILTVYEMKFGWDDDAVPSR
ncbi:hypothetical protein AAVH_20478 [Aphelenchoides avenae]|nr:hypothetical protein AAVH_20478 [Aphelenchus avenae]